PAQLAALPRSEGQTVERILLPGAPLSHGAPLYPAEESKEGLYSVEMAAFAEPDLAEAAKASLVRAHGDLLSRDSVTVAAIDGAVEEQRYRVVADPLALKTAEDLCRALRKRGQGCQVIPLTSVSPPASGQISAD
ncbi:MAG: SPOR domain-containing protein, partial [Limibacillus sp.]